MGEQFVLEKESAGQSTRWICSDKWFSDSWLNSVEILFTDHVVLYYTKGFCHPLSGFCCITGRRRKGKGLVVPCRYNYYCEPTKDPVLIDTFQNHAHFTDAILNGPRNKISLKHYWNNIHSNFSFAVTKVMELWLVVVKITSNKFPGAGG